MSFLYKADPVRGARWAERFAEQAPDIDFRIWPDIGDASRVEYLATWVPPQDMARQFPNLKAVFSTGAGVDQIDFSQVPAHVPIVRMLEPAIADHMVEYVVHAVLTVHREFGEYGVDQREGRWQVRPNRLARDIRVGVLGLGQLARAVLSRLRLFDYSCAGWSRSAHHIEGVACFSGEAGLEALLARSDILVCLLPLTPQTRGILGAELLGRLPAGASLVQTGRGAHLDQQALLDLLDTGHLRWAFLDVTEPEPLPPDHPLWRHPRVRITPHIASSTNPDTAVTAVLENLARLRRGERLDGEVDRERGY
ncbi:glyoxylate/hydroxypyruvate reductase A [Xylophilus rhododendri]|uniref:Glyoxylate/hydroxypyruvate reductase A n=1 Tax=Xylophilus rhododendri TaxID=2697032 RepID=A0A857JCJ0_9BURK|nr:glyoxylate/hydroxypyruvate reductase A [Xylophilus rhododendri]QHJ00902.1 glyoxylate/hydroxypyruvate reductase A [Xylophilus rhododendri]